MAGRTQPATTATEDLAKIDECQRWGDDLSRPLTTSYFFSNSRQPGPEPWEAGDELERLGFEAVVFDEAGGGNWHVTAFGRELLSPDGVARRRAEMEDIARRYDLVYDGWDRTRTLEEERRGQQARR
jgi:hypothetical protein